MKTLIDDKAYLVQDESEVIHAIRKIVPIGGLDYTDDEMFISEAVRGYEDLPKTYPFILIGTYVDTGYFSHIDVVGFDQSVFEVSQ